MKPIIEVTDNQGQPTTFLVSSSGAPNTYTLIGNNFHDMATIYVRIAEVEGELLGTTTSSNGIFAMPFQWPLLADGSRIFRARITVLSQQIW